MAAVILPPQDCFGKGLRHRGLVQSRRNSNHNSSSSSVNPKFNRDDTTCSGRRMSAAVGVKAHRRVNRGRSRVGEASTVAAKISPKNLIMGEVKILKRGETLSPDRGVGGGKDFDGIYGGSGSFFASSPPSWVPLPSFLGKNGAVAAT